MNPKVSDRKNIVVSRIRSFFPALIILVFCMVALHSAVEVITANDAFFNFYLKESSITPLSNSNFLNEMQHLKFEEKMLYWSVISLGFFGFVLVVLNARKLQEIKAANEEKIKTLKLLEDRLAAMENTSDGIAIMDSDGALTYMNRALMKMHAIDYGEELQFLGEYWTHLYTQKERADIEKNIVPALMREGEWRGAQIVTRRDGGVIHTELSVTILPNGGMIATVRDVSDAVKVAQEKDDLQLQVFQAQKMEAVGRLTGGVAHDFNNILAAMNGYAEFLLEDLDADSPQHKFAANILSAGKQAKDLVNQMLTFSRRTDGDHVAIDVVKPVEETLSIIRSSFPKTLEISADIDLKSAMIEANATQISQVLMNLCVNARDAMEGKNGSIYIALERVNADAFAQHGIVTADDPAGKDHVYTQLVEVSSKKTRYFLGQLQAHKAYVCLTVQDTGAGMPRDVMEKVFDPFFTTKPVGKGTGLGLSTVHGVIAGHGGALILESKLGKGTLFQVFFPLLDQAAEEQAQDEIDERDFDVGAGLILLVEDQQEVRDMMALLLERLGYETQQAQDGKEAHEILTEHPDAFDLVITDHNMPRMTGLELVQAVHPENPDLPFILLSGFSEEKMEKLMREHEAIKQFLRKPISKNVLQEKIEFVLKADNKSQSAA